MQAGGYITTNGSIDKLFMKYEPPKTIEEFRIRVHLLNDIQASLYTGMTWDDEYETYFQIIPYDGSWMLITQSKSEIDNNVQYQEALYQYHGMQKAGFYEEEDN